MDINFAIQLQISVNQWVSDNVPADTQNNKEIHSRYPVLLNTAVVISFNASCHLAFLHSQITSAQVWNRNDVRGSG